MNKKPRTATVDRIVRELAKTGNEPGYEGGALLLGAGVSKSANIPLAGEIVRIIENDYPDEFNDAAEKTYAHCMGALKHKDRHKLIAKLIDNDTVKINLAHMAVSQMIEAGHMGRVLTTNFDPLVARACAMINCFPAIFDMAASQDFNAALIDGIAIFHLHGQRGGIAQFHEPIHFAKLGKVLGPLFHNVNDSRTWIVVGYSGENDPVIEQLAALPDFNHRLFWVCYEDNDPHPNVMEKLFDGTKDTFLVKGKNADQFLTGLALGLDCFNLRYFDRPFSFLKELTDQLTDHVTDEKLSAPSVTDQIVRGRNLIEKAIVEYESNEALEASEDDKNAAVYALMAGDYEKAIKHFEATPKDSRDADDFANWGVALSRIGDSAQSDEKARAWYERAAEKYETATKLNPDYASAFCHWGNTLGKLGNTSPNSEEARAWFERAAEKHETATKLKPDDANALYNWGITLGNLGDRTESDDEAKASYKRAVEKYEAATKLKPNDSDAFYNWGVALGKLGNKAQNDEEGKACFQLAVEKYETATKLKPDHANAFYNWSIALIHLAHLTKGRGKMALLSEAEEKCLKALKINPKISVYNLACIASLRGDDAACRKWLEQDRDNGTLPSKEHLMADKDLDPMRDKAWFTAFLDGLD